MECPLECPDRPRLRTFRFGSPADVQKPYWTFYLGVVDHNGLLERRCTLHWSCGVLGTRHPNNVIGAMASEYRVFSVHLVEE